MEETYDVIILGTGLKECILSGLLSVSGQKVLHLDRNDYYGAESASLNLKQLFKKFENNDADNDNKDDEKKYEELGQSKNYSVDLCPKFIMGTGNLVKMLLHTKVTRYLEFRSVDGSFVYKDGKVFPVPMTTAAALKSSLMGIFQKRFYKGFLSFVLEVKVDDPETWQKLDLNTMTMKDVFTHYRCDDNTIAFTSHAVALYDSDDFLTDKTKTLECITKLQLYAWSLAKFEKSPYIYPVWGLGGLPEGFSRLAAVHGGVYMLRREIENILYDDNGKVTGVQVKDEGKAYCKQLIGDPSYFFGSDKIKKTGRVARWLCILDHSVKDTADADSAQIILPTKQTGHKTDIYVSVMSSAMQVSPKNRWIAMISSKVYTNNPKEELKVAYGLLGNVLKDFFHVYDTYEAANGNVDDQVFVPSSMDATTHFEHTTTEVMALYKQITGKDVDLHSDPQAIGTDAQFE